MKVLQITNYYYPNYGGIEQVANDIARVLKENGIENKVVCTNTDASAGGFECRKGEDSRNLIDGVEVIRCRSIAKIASQSVSPSFPRLLNELMKDFEPDCVILHYPNPYEAFFALKYRKTSVRFILYWHSDIVKQKLLGKLFYLLENRLGTWADVIVATSPCYIEKSRLLQRYKRKCVVVPNCVNEVRLQPTEGAKLKSEQIRLESDGKIICFAMGRLVQYKGFEYLIRASKMLPENIIVFIAGTGPLESELKAEAQNDDKIHFVGRLNDDELIAYYLACDIFCFPSITKNEAFGVVLAEAMYFGHPAITFSIKGSGVNYVNLANVTGLECPNRNIEALAKAIENLADDVSMRKILGDQARERVLDLFTFEIFKKNIINLINSI